MSVHPDMVDFETGEVLEGGRTPLQIAKSELAAFKFAVIDTVRADPRLSTAPCLAVMSVYLGFVTLDERTLKPTPAYASTVTLMARACIKSKTTARAARKLLAAQGYLVHVGETKDGCEKYRVENPHAERVQAHVREAEEYLKQVEAVRREDERAKKRRVQPDRGSEVDPTRDMRGANNWPDRGSEVDPNYRREHLGGFSSEEEGIPIGSTTSSVYGQEDDPDLPYPVPNTAEELQAMLEGMFAGWRPSPELMAGMRGLLMAGRLTPHMVETQRRFAA